jgi:hypothetical protein
LLLKDLFAGTNGTNLSAHAMDLGSGWAAPFGATRQFQLNGSGGCVPQDSININASTVAAPQPDVDVIVTVNFSVAAGLAKVVARFQNTANYFTAVLDGSGTNGFYLEEWSVGHATLISVPFVPVIGTNYTIELKAKGPVFTGYVNGVQQWTWMSSDLLVQRACGISWLGTVSNVVFSNFQTLAA